MRRDGSGEFLMVSLLVDTESFLEAGAHARSVADSVDRAVTRAVSGFSGSHHMAGSDPHGLKWAASYDDAGGRLMGYAAQLTDGLHSLSRKLTVTGGYYELAELANAGVTEAALTLPPPVTASPRPHLPSAAGGQRKFPNPNPAFEWVAEQIANWVGDMWPDGDTDKLNHASTVWHALADDLDDAASNLMSVSASLTGVDTPELPEVHHEIAQVRSFAKKLATACRQVGKACNDLSGQIAHVHVQTEITVGITIGVIAATVAAGLGLTVVTFGVSDAAAAGGVVAEVSAAAGTITGFIAELASTISVGVGLVVESAASLVGISADLAATIGITVGDVSASAVLWGAAGAAENVVVTTVTEPGADLVDAAGEGFISWGAAGALGGGITRGIQLVGQRGVVLEMTTADSAAFDINDKSTWPWDFTDPAQVYENAFHNMDSDTVTLGKWFGPDSPDTYFNIAKSQGTAYFQLEVSDGMDLWAAVRDSNGMSERDMFETVNSVFLDDAMLEGKTIEFSYPPEGAGGALEDEYKYIFEGPFAGKYDWDPTIGPGGAAVPR
jgi:hypothetical protein